MEVLGQNKLNGGQSFAMIADEEGGGICLKQDLVNIGRGGVFYLNRDGGRKTKMVKKTLGGLGDSFNEVHSALPRVQVRPSR